MKISKMTKDQLELLSYLDITNLVLEETPEKSTADLFKKIVDLLELPSNVFEKKIGAYYTSLTTDKRFVLLDNGKWDLRSRHIVKPIIDDEDLEDIDTDDIVEELEEEKDNFYDGNATDDDTDDQEEYKNLVIVDEEDLDLEQ